MQYLQEQVDELKAQIETIQLTLCLRGPAGLPGPPEASIKRLKAPIASEQYFKTKVFSFIEYMVHPID